MPLVAGVKGSRTTNTSVWLRNGVSPASPAKHVTPSICFSLRLQPFS